MNKRFIISSVLLFTISLILVVDASAQRRDFLTEQEIELVRDNQDIDKRIVVLTKMIDRRFTAMGIEVGGWKQAQKENELWGEMRKGTREQLLLDVRQLLQKAIDDIDDVAMHNENTLTQNKTEGLLFPKAVRDLATAATRYMPALKSLLDKVTEDRERGLVLASIEHCQDILDAAVKLPPETKQEKKKKGTR